MQSRSALFRATAAAVSAGLCLLALSGCTDADDPLASDPAAAGSQEPGPTPSSKAARPAPTSTDGVDEKVDGADQVAVVASYFVNSDDGRDTLELTFNRPISGYSAQYVDKVTKEPSGKAVKLEGKADLKLVVRGATLDDTEYVSEGTEPTKFTASLEFKPRMLAINEVRPVGDVDSTLTFGIGVSKKVPFTVTVEDGGKHLILDLVQPSLS